MSNIHYEAIREILNNVKSQYATLWGVAGDDPKVPITERDVVSDVRQNLLSFCEGNDLSVHSEIKPAAGTHIGPKDTKGLQRIDVVVLKNSNKQSWFDAAKTLQDKYEKGAVEARFSSIPIQFFHTAIEVKIQSKIENAKKDITTLADIRKSNHSCNCFFVLLNGRGMVKNHDEILEWGNQAEIEVIEYTARRHGQHALGMSSNRKNGP